MKLQKLISAALVFLLIFCGCNKAQEDELPEEWHRRGVITCEKRCVFEGAAASELNANGRYYFLRTGNVTAFAPSVGVRRLTRRTASAASTTRC